MRRSQRDDVLTLALRRYPKLKSQPLLALLQFGSDRRTAGLGALANRKGTGNVRCGKEPNLLTNRVTYFRIIDIPPRDKLPPFDPMQGIGGPMAMNARVTIVRVPARKSHLCFPCDRRDLLDQRGRDMVAAGLRLMRRRAQEQEKAAW